MEQIKQSKAIINKQKTELKETQECNLKVVRVALEKLQYKLNTEQIQISRERQEIEQEKSQLLIQKQELVEEEAQTKFERRKLRITKASLIRLQGYVVDEEQKNLAKKRELNDYELLIIKKKEQLLLKEKALKQALISSPLVKKSTKTRIEEDKDISQTHSSRNKKSDNEELINASGITAKFPNNTSNSKDEIKVINFRKEQELEDRLKGLEEEKMKIEVLEKEIEAQMTVIKNTKATLSKKLETTCSHFSFAKKDEVPDTGSEIHKVEVVVNETKEGKEPIEEAQDNDSMEFYSNPDFLRMINENVERNNEAHYKEPSDDETQNVNISEIDNKEIINNTEIYKEDDSSDESSIYKGSELFDQPKRAKYGIISVNINE